MNRTRFAERRRELGLTQRELARRLDVTQQFIALVDAGKRRPNPRLGRRLEKLLGCASGALWPEAPLLIPIMYRLIPKNGGST